MSIGISTACETLRIMQERLHECLVASRHLVIAEEVKNIYLIGVKFQDLWKVQNDYMYYVECGFLVIEKPPQMFIVESKNSYIIDEYTKFGSIRSMEIIDKVTEADIFEDYKIAYSRMKAY